jgi:lipopolysaccharide biosynthesis regulator YciM
LLTRDEIQKKHKELALKELGRDYVLAGFLERAESAYIQLLDSEQYYSDAQFQLFNIYQTTKEWDNAIELSEKMTKGRAPDDEVCKHIGHFYCERAVDYSRDKEFSKAISLLKKAISVDEHNVRPWMLLGDLALKENDHNKALDCYSEVVQRDTSWLSEVVLKMETCSEALGDSGRLEKVLKDNWQSCASAYLVKTRLLLKESEQQANTFLLESLEKSPTMKGFHFLLEKYKTSAADTEFKQLLETLQSLIAKQGKIRPDYRCQNCGFAGKKVYWLCPSCKKWGTVKPIKGLDGE